MSTIAVIGTGYVGLTTGAYLAHLGHSVVCADVVPDKVERLNRGDVPIFEAGLDELVREGLDSGRLAFVLGAEHAIEEAEFVFLCVQTPQGDDGSADLTYVRQAAADIGAHLKPESVVINKSTVPVGSTRVVEQALGRDDVFVVSNPEFLREGSAVYDCLHPDRIVIGSDDQAAAMRVRELFESLRAPVVITDPASAETIKYASNAFLATKVSFVNALANVCEAVGADVREVVLGMGYDKRIGFEFLKPGPGWGGSCFPKDTRAMLRIAEDGGYDFGMLKGVIAVNDEQYDRMASKVERAAGGSLEGKLIAAWGLTFKARTDDLRDSPAIEVIRRLESRGAKVRAYDPAIKPGASAGPLEGIDVCADPYSPCEGADVLTVLTEWDEFRWLEFATVAGLMRSPVIVDTRNLLEPAAVRRRGFSYTGLGREQLPGTSGRRVVVTGGAGFLGSHLCDSLLARGDEVVAIDNLVSGRLENIEHLFGRDGFTYARHDVSGYVWVPGPVDAVLHFASPASPKDYLEFPIQTLKVGSLGTHNCLGLAKDKGARFLLASTSEVYGDPQVHPQPESYWGNVNPVGPRGVYDEAKRFAEAMAMAYQRHHGMDVRIVRIFNVYGPRMRPDRRPGGLQLPGAGPPRQAHHDLRRRVADPELLLRRGRDPGLPRPARLRPDRAGEHRQPGGVHHPRAGRAGHRRDQLVVRDRPRAAARRRPHPAPAGPHPRPHRAGVGAARSSSGRA